ncbi:MAG: Holliday junction resolvase RuvX [Acidobacteria bacterium]|jgi:putative Holliday junction resolvase|nr:Holliday junction resolvase RuvX [Acidobacteriota bacterium]
MRVMALDYGAKAIGVALSDELQLTVRPLTTLRRDKLKYEQVLDRIGALIAEHEVGTLIVGLPLNMDGTAGPAVTRVERFIADLQARLTVPIVSVDERLTSREADELLREMGVSQRERKAKSDEYAATIILQDYLDGQARLSAANLSSNES